MRNWQIADAQMQKVPYQETGIGRGTSTTRRAPRGQREEQFLTAIKKNPGAPVSQIAKDVGVSPNQLYTVAHRLHQKGEIRKRGKGHGIKS
jgi:hypothetical protein